MNIMLILKGILIGIGKIIPGVSGSVMAISLSVYDQAIYCVTHFFDDVKKNFRYLFFLGIGILLGIVFFSKVILYFLDYYYVFTMILFIGLIMGGIVSIYHDSDHSKMGILFLVLGFLFMGCFSFFGGNGEYDIQGNFFDVFVYFFSGLLEGIGTIIPGISSTALLMIVGVYHIFISSVSNLLSISFVFDHFVFLVSFGLGLFVSIILCIYVVSYLFSRYKKRTFSFILGMVLSNVIFLLLQVFVYIDIKNLIIVILLLGIGFFISLSIGT